MHDWEKTFAPTGRGGTHGARHPPTWKCRKCGTRVEDWDNPPGELRVRVAYRRGEDVLVSCDEYVAIQVMES